MARVEELARRRASDDAAVEGTSRSRNYYSIGLRGVIVLALVIAGVIVFTRIGERHPVLAVARPVAAGQVIQASDLREVKLPKDQGIDPVAARDRSKVVGKVAKVTLIPGTTLAWDALEEAPAALGANEAVVGIALKPGMYPSELRAGDRVRVVEAGTAGASSSEAPSALVPDARVRSVARDTERGQGGIVVSLVVPVDKSAAVAAGASAGRISLAVVGSV